jgi:hypothetical protein
VAEDAGKAIVKTGAWCVHHPGDCALNGADLVPFLGSGIRCTQWAVQAAEHHVSGDTPGNCLGNLAGDIIPFGKVGLAASKLGRASLQGGARSAREMEKLNEARRKAAALAKASREQKLRKGLAKAAAEVEAV